jgi:hypothetical protein
LPWDQNGFLPGYKYAAWDALRNDNNNAGGKVTREQAEDKATTALTAILGSSVLLYPAIILSVFAALQNQFSSGASIP